VIMQCGKVIDVPHCASVGHRIFALPAHAHNVGRELCYDVYQVFAEGGHHFVAVFLSSGCFNQPGTNECSSVLFARGVHIVLLTVWIGYVVDGGEHCVAKLGT